jgi:hypothetical protein
MDVGTVVVAAFGIFGTVAAAAISPVVTARHTRRDKRASTYAETLALLWMLNDRAQFVVTTPGFPIEKAPFERLRRAGAEARLIGGRRVREKLRRASELANKFELRLAAGERDLAVLARQLYGAVVDLENAMRAEVG